MKLVQLFALIALALEACSTTRVKRIIRGDGVHSRDTGYKAVNYFAVFGTEHGKPWWTVGFWNFAKKLGLYGEIICGGALLTPQMVQTACHCISTFPFTYRDVYVAPALINHHWEGTMSVYIGTNYRFPTYGHEDVMSMLTIPQIESQKFFVHPKCGKLPEGGNALVSFDVGIIKINSQWSNGHYGVPTKTIAFAPLYTHKHLNAIFSHFMEIQPVCLIIGFGYYAYDYPHPSDVLLHGWSTLRQYKDCIQSTTTNNPDVNNYTTYLSWVCARSVVKLDQAGYPGDSGSPVSCNNVFIGVMSSLFYEQAYQNDLYTANKYTPFLSAYESRRELIELINTKDAYSYPDEVAYFYKLKTPRSDLKRRGIGRSLGKQYIGEDYEEHIVSKSHTAHVVPRVVAILILAIHLIK